MYYCALSFGVLQHILPRFLVTCAIWCVLEYRFRELSLKKYYNYLNNIDMALLRTSYICTGASSNTILDYMQFSAFWSMHDKTSS